MIQPPAAATGTVMRSDILRGFARDAGFSDLKFVSGPVWGSLNALAAWELLLAAHASTLFSDGESNRAQQGQGSLAGVDTGELNDERDVRLDHHPVVDAEGHPLGIDQIVEAHAPYSTGLDGKAIGSSRLAVSVEDREFNAG